MRAFVRYLASAGTASVADFVVAQSLLSLLFFQSNIGFGACVAAGALVGMSVNFLLSRSYVFNAHNAPMRRQAPRFVLVSLSTLILRVVTGYLLVALFSTPLFGWLALLSVDAIEPRLAQVGAMGLVTFYSFVAHRHYSFSTTPLDVRQN